MRSVAATRFRVLCSTSACVVLIYSTHGPVSPLKMS